MAASLDLGPSRPQWNEWRTIVKKIKKPMSSKGKLVMSLATAGMLTLGTLGTALADTSNQAAGERRGVFGSVTAKGQNTLTLLVNSGETLVLTVNKQTQFQVPGKAGSTLSDVGAGTRVAALVQRDADGLTALKVMPMHHQPQREHRVLTVVKVDGKTLIAQDAQGNQITVELAHEVSPALAGQLTTFVGEHSQQSNRFKANAEVKIEHIAERLEAHATRLQEEAGTETDDSARIRKEQDARHLRDKVETNRQRHLDRLEQVIDKAPREAKRALEQARDRFEAQQKEDRARFEAQQEQARARFKEQYEARLRALENPQGMPPERPGVIRPRPDAVDANSGPRALQGVVQAVDASTGKLILMTVDGKVVTLQVGQEFDIRLGDRTVPLSEVAAGAKVTVHYNRDRSAVDGVQVKNEAWEVLMGTVKSVDAAAGTVTIVTREGEERTLKLSPSAPQQVLGGSKELQNVQPGTEVIVKYRMSRGEVIELTFGRVDEVQVKNEAWDVLTGTLMSVEPDAGTVTVGTREGSVLTLKVSPAAPQQARGAIKELANVRPGTQVTIKYRTSGGQIIDLAFGRMEGAGPIDRPVAAPTDLQTEQELAQKRLLQMEQEKARARFHEEQAQAWRLFQDQQGQALKRLHAEQEQVQAKFLEDQKLALARFQEQTKDEQARARFLEDQKLALARFHEEQAQALKRFQTDQEQARTRFLEDQKLALARFQAQQ